MSQAATLGEALRGAIRTLSAGGVEAPEAEARTLLGWVAGIDQLTLATGGRMPIPPGAEARLAGALARRLAGEPSARILGMREFRGLSFKLSPDTLEPRDDSEVVVERGLAALKQAKRPSPRILDLGCGTGCLLLALLHERRDAFGIGVDLSEGAARTACENAIALGLRSRALILRGDWTEALAGPFDLIISNPPYIRSGVIPALDREVRLHDPPLALDGGADGLAAYRRIIPALPRLLAPRAMAVLEIGYDQHDLVERLAREAGARHVELARDLGGRPRALEIAWD